MIEETYNKLKEIYEKNLKPFWDKNPSEAYFEFGNFHFFVNENKKELLKYHSGPSFVSRTNVIQESIKKNFDESLREFKPEYLNDKLFTDKTLAEFEASFMQLGLAIKSDNKF